MAHYKFDRHPNHFVSGRSGRWFIYAYPPQIGDGPVSGPFRTHKECVTWLASADMNAEV